MYFSNIKIGNIKISFNCPSRRWQKFIKKNYHPFLVAKSSAYKVTLKCNKNPIQNKLSVTKSINKWIIKRDDFVSFTTFNLKNTDLEITENKYSFDSWLRIYFTLLALKNRGILVHGAGYFLSSREYPSKNSGVYLFIGRSGAGKSSLIKILGREYALSDELVHIYEKSGRIFGASTPFWGELKKGCGKVYQGKIKNIFLLEHSKTNAIKSLRSNEAVKGILKNVLFFSKNNRNIEKLLNLSSNITKKLSIYGLGFRLDVKRKDLIGLISEKYEN